jgi:short-subunit dehydrogenase
MRLNGKTVVITGASSGIGKATALAFAKEGANIVLLARNETNLRIAEDELKKFDIRTLVIPVDVSNREQVHSAVSRVYEEFDAIDILVCSAGIYHRSPIKEIGIEDFRSVMDINFFGTLHCIYAFLPRMIERKGGNIIIISSMDGRKGLPFDGAYVSSKFALAGFGEVLRQELRGTGVRVSTVFPGRVDTPMITNVDAPAITPKIPPERVARSIIRGIKKKKAEVVVPYISSRFLLLLNSFSCHAGDTIVRLLKISPPP